MRIGHKLLLGFLSIALLFTAAGYITLIQLDKIAKPLNKDIPEDILAISDATFLDELTHSIQYYDEILTQSARNYAFTEDEKWKLRYYDTEPQLDWIIKQAIARSDHSGKKFFARVNKANIKLVEIEHQSFELVDSGKAKEAIKLLESDIYWENKHIYTTSLEAYINAADVTHTEAMTFSSITLDAAIINVQNLISYSKHRALYIIFLILISVLGISVFVSRTITKPLRILSEGMKIVGKGNLDYKGNTGSKDEIGQLSRAFDQMINNLEQSTTSIKNLNREISERKKAEANLKGSEEKFRTLYESSRDAIMLLTPEKGFFAGNLATLQMFKCTDEEEFTSQSPSVLSPEYQPDGELSTLKAQKMMEIALKNGSHSFEWKHKKLNGKEFFAIVLLTRFNLQGSPTLQATVRDISLRKQTESSLKEAYSQLKETQQKLVQSEKLAALCRLSTAIAHEIKSPLGSILSGIEFLEEETKQSPKEIRTALDKIKKITLDANQTLLHFLKFSMPGDLKFEKTSLKQIIEESLSLFVFKIPKAIKITTDLIDKKVSLNLDKKLIKQTILNILTNALDSINEKGEIILKTYLFNKKNYVIEISDTGEGISKKNLENIFEPFYSTKRPDKGTGLGLFIAKTITGAHGGDIIIESALGKGTLVKIILPIYKEETK